MNAVTIAYQTNKLVAIYDYAHKRTLYSSREYYRHCAIIRERIRDPFLSLVWQDDKDAASLDEILSLIRQT